MWRVYFKTEKSKLKLEKHFGLKSENVLINDGSACCKKNVKKKFHHKIQNVTKKDEFVVPLNCRLVKMETFLNAMINSVCVMPICGTVRLP